MTARPQLIAMGDNCLDVYLSKNRLAVGGNALNVAAQWRRQGLCARYFGVVGTDTEGALILDAIRAAGLAPDDTAEQPGASAVTLLQERNGDRRFLLEDLGVGLGYSPDPARMAAMLAADWLHLGTNADAGLVRHLVEAGARFSVDLSVCHDSLDLSGVSLVLASGPEEMDRPIEPVLAALRERAARRSLVTCGRRGAFFEDDGQVTHVPARPIAVLDTCGAGDSFIATFLARYVLDGLSAEASMHLATEAAAQTCLHEAGFPQVLTPIPAWLLDKYADVIAAAAG